MFVADERVDARYGILGILTDLQRQLHIFNRIGYNISQKRSAKAELNRNNGLPLCLLGNEPHHTSHDVNCGDSPVRRPWSFAQIPKPADAPQPMTPEQSAAAFKLPDGFRMEIVPSEPFIASPNGVCWDEHGRMLVCELHGYNLEGQLDIEKLERNGGVTRRCAACRRTSDSSAPRRPAPTGW